MRSLLLTGLFASLLLQSAAQTAPTPLAQAGTTPLQSAHLSARVGTNQGKYVFYNNQPTSAYDVVFTFASTYKPSESMTLNTTISGCLAGALMESGAQLKAFDAVIIQAGTRDVAIKFRADVPPEQRPLATVTKQAGFPIFIFCEPVSDYQVVKTEGVSWYNHAFGGAFYSFSHVQENLVKTAAKTKKTQAIIFGETASYISFN